MKKSPIVSLNILLIYVIEIKHKSHLKTNIILQNQNEFFEQELVPTI